MNDMKMLHNDCVCIHLKFSNISLLMDIDQQKVLTEISTMGFTNVI